VDQLGGLDRAIELVKEKAKIPKDEKITIVTYPPKRSIFDVMFGHSGDNSADVRLAGLLREWQARIWMKGGMLRLMPYRIEFK